MNPQQLLQIISHGKNLRKEDFQQLVKLHESFPYFQVPKILLAKYEYLKTSGNSQEFLHWAAVTSPDRVWLKSFLENDSHLDDLQMKLLEKLTLEEKNKPLDTHVSPAFNQGDMDENLIPGPEQEVDLQQRAGILKKLGEDLHQHKHPNPTQPIPQPESHQEKTKVSHKPGNQDLMDSIKRKAKKEILDEKKKEQIDLIKAFSKREFKLASLKEMENFQKQEDLSKSSTQLNASLISESYAKLLLDQGKKQKAKEIYRKLMMKFPDKSSYFAELLKAIEYKN